jgi:hypothetical protein
VRSFVGSTLAAVSAVEQVDTYTQRLFRLLRAFLEPRADELRPRDLDMAVFVLVNAVEALTVRSSPKESSPMSAERPAPANVPRRAAARPSLRSVRAVPRSRKESAVLEWRRVWSPACAQIVTRVLGVRGALREIARLSEL